MILQSLYELYGRLADDPAYEISEFGYSPQKISFKIVLFPDSRFEIQDARKTDEKGKLRPTYFKVPGDGKRSGSKPVPFFTWDNALYLLGIPPSERSQDWADERREAFLDKHIAILESVDSPFLQKACQFLRDWNPCMAEDPKNKIISEIVTHYGVLQLAGTWQYLHEDPALLSLWDAENGGSGQPDGQCLITGTQSKIARLHPTIKGITPPKGKQQKDGPLVSIDKGSPAFASYGKTQSYNSPVGEDAAFRYGTALNAMLNGPKSHKHRMRIGDTTCVFWTDRESLVEDIFAEFASDGSHAVEQVQDPQMRQKLEVFLKALRQGRESDLELDSSPDSTRFYLLGLAPNAARLSVRFFYQSSLSELLSNLRAHRRDLEIIREFESPVGKRRADSDFPAYWEFLRETVRQGDDPSPLLGGAMLRSILEATPYPESLFTAILRRVHIERSVNYIKAAAIKSVLVRNHKKSIHIMLDQENKESSYLLGRLFAILEKIQEEGHREQTGRSLDKTIRETYFSTACSTPAAVFPRIEQLSTHHRRHLNPGRKVQFDRMIADVKWPQEPSVGIKKSHNLEEQGLFILGYYHQRRSLFSKVEADSAVATA
ncbi:CRISPR-associated protein, Csd1 family [Verrucomicrobiia bacterium DG1235]|nr:CRISPR-associated protein, Csd1 family [Verrucomicrobiae bacterium DG1235]